MSKRYFQAFALELPNGIDSAPKLSARGEYELAQHIVRCARKYGIPVVERPELCSALDGVELDQEIPTELFEAAAALLAEVGALNIQEIREQHAASMPQKSPIRRTVY
jgi:flagellar biosynthesis protein